jgi:hypothetical protein
MPSREEEPRGPVSTFKSSACEHDRPAGDSIQRRTKFTPPGHLLSPWTGFAVFCGCAATTLIAAAITLRRRDA